MRHLFQSALALQADPSVSQKLILNEKEPRGRPRSPVSTHPSFWTHIIALTDVPLVDIGYQVGVIRHGRGGQLAHPSAFPKNAEPPVGFRQPGECKIQNHETQFVIDLCHLAVHNGKLNIIGWRTTGNGRELHVERPTEEQKESGEEKTEKGQEEIKSIVKTSNHKKKHVDRKQITLLQMLSLQIK